MNVNEIFYSIDGEGVRAGELATFIRLSGCNLNCRYCDTRYAFNSDCGTEMSVEDILHAVEAYNCSNITLTGGEPLIHSGVDELINALTARDYFVNIETNGSVDVSKYIENDNTIITMDYKSKSSGMSHKNNTKNIAKLRFRDVLKCVMNREDMGMIKDMLLEYKPECYIYLSPIFGEIEPAELVEFEKELHSCGLSENRLRVQLQLHKYIWDVNKRGV